MKRKKILIFGLITALILITTTMVSAVNTTTSQQNKQEKPNKLDSPLFKTRTKQSINEKTQQIKQKIQNFITNLLENRIFLVFPTFINGILKNGEEGNDIASAISYDCVEKSYCETACDTCFKC
ncbi:MAG: hypothetical protein V5A64_05885 [Candidatus Thermoplasmatota archaeon]